MDWAIFTKGQEVRLDAGLSTSSIVAVVEQTLERMFTTVTSDDVNTWSVMTRRLTSCDVDNENKKFHDWLNDQFNNVESAKKWYDEWTEEQETPFGLISLRVMAFYVSMILEGKQWDSGAIMTNYYSTKYGRYLYLDGPIREDSDMEDVVKEDSEISPLSPLTRCGVSFSKEQIEEIRRIGKENEEWE